MLPLREYLAERRQEVQAQIKSLKAELGELDRAASALEPVDVARSTQERGATGSGRKTIKELALQALRENPDGLEASAMVTWMASKGHVVARESLSPQLSRLKEDHRVILEGTRWHAITAASYPMSEPSIDDIAESQAQAEAEEVLARENLFGSGAAPHDPTQGAPHYKS